jgi:predicted MFS family arabinose efflux permease
MAPFAFISGLSIAPLISTGSHVVGDIAPEGAVTEAFTWPITALVIGISLGNAAAGAIAGSAGWRESFVIATCAALLGAAIAVTQRRTLQPA